MPRRRKATGRKIGIWESIERKSFNERESFLLKTFFKLVKLNKLFLFKFYMFC